MLLFFLPLPLLNSDTCYHLLLISVITLITFLIYT
nr:MAG TPA: hypothetical protein [Caudoviricetes sp.]